MIKRRLRHASIVVGLTALVLLFQNFDVPNNTVPAGSGLRPYANNEVMLYNSSGSELTGWVADPGAELLAATDISYTNCHEVLLDSDCENFKVHFFKRNSADVNQSSLRLKGSNFLKNQLYRVEFNGDSNRDLTRLDFFVNQVRIGSAELRLVNGTSLQSNHFYFYSNQFENELSFATDKVGDILKIRSIRVYRLPREDQLLADGGFDHSLVHWTVDTPGPQIRLSQSALHYHRKNAAYNSAFMRTKLVTQPNKIYKVLSNVKSNTNVMRFLINGISAHDFQGVKGLDSFAFQAKTPLTELALGGTYSWVAEFSIDSIQVLETSNSDFEFGLMGWTIDNKIIVTAAKNDLRYQRNNAAWASNFMHKKIATVPGTQYEVKAQVGNNSNTLAFQIDGLLVKQSNKSSGLVKFLFTAKNPETVISVGGANSFLASFQLTNFSVSPYWSEGGQYLFATSTKYPGYMVGHQTANQYCAQHAQQAKLLGTFKAVLAADYDQYSSATPIDRYPILYPLMNSQGYFDELCDEKGNCENLGNSWIGARWFTIGAPGRNCNNWTQHDYKPTVTYDIRGNPIYTMPAIPDHKKFGSFRAPSLSIPNFEVMHINQSGADCATTKLSLLCLQDAESVFYKRRRVYITSMNDLLGPVNYSSGPRTVEGNYFVLQAKELNGISSQPVKVSSSLLRNNSYSEYYKDKWIGALHIDNLEALASSVGLTIEFPELVASAQLTLASLQRLSALPYIDPHQPMKFGGEDSSYEILINGRVVQRVTVPRFNPEDPLNYRAYGWISVSNEDKSPFKTMQIRVIEGPTDLVRLYEIGFVTHN